MPDNFNRQADLYWTQFARLKNAAVCIRLYRDDLARTVRTVELVKAFGSNGAVAAWVLWKDWPMLWSGIIAGAQLLDATKHVFPFARLHKAASELTPALDLLFIDAEAEWAEIQTMSMRDAEIIQRRKRLAKLWVETEYKFFPGGFAPRESLERKAKRITDAFLAATYGEAVRPAKAPTPQIPDRGG